MLGRTAVRQGPGPGLQPVAFGTHAGANSTVLTTGNLPSHSHPAAGGNLAAQVAIPVNNTLGDRVQPSALMVLAGGADSEGGSVYVYNEVAATTLLMPFNAPFNAGATGSNTGGNAPVNVTNPFVGSNYIIETEGIFPSRP